MKLTHWPLLALTALLFTQVNAYSGGDPFADDPFADDPFVNEPAIENNKHQSRIALKSYYQNNDLRSSHPFNPGAVTFADAVTQLSLDIELESDWQNQWKTRTRVYQRYVRENLNGHIKDKGDSHLLEGLVQWQSENRNLVIEAGRSKPQWSNGYSYDIANLLQPQRTLPYIDQENALQSKGWDMVSGQYFSGPWSFAAYLADSDSRYIDADTEAVMRLGYQQDDAFSLLLHKIDGQDLTYGATYSSLLTDAVTFRAEWTRHSYRQIEPLQVADWQSKQKSNYQRFVVGSTYTAPAGWSLTGEYFYNGHGASKQEWQNLTADAKASAGRIKENQSSNPADDYNNAFAGLAFMGQGWSRERYLSVMFMSAESENLWQLRLSSQISLDDDSQLHRFELLKSFTDNLSARLQWQIFNGCELCEYGLNPSKNNIRLTASWLY